LEIQRVGLLSARQYSLSQQNAAWLLRGLRVVGSGKKSKYQGQQNSCPHRSAPCTLQSRCKRTIDMAEIVQPDQRFSGFMQPHMESVAEIGPWRNVIAICSNSSAPRKKAKNKLTAVDGACATMLRCEAATR
jgi:hypothetical protein